MMRVKKYVAAAAVCASMVCAAVWVGRIDNPVSIAFADVQASAQKFKTIQYSEMAAVFDADGNPQNPASQKADGKDQEKQKKGWPSERHFIMGQDLERIETRNGEGQVTHVNISNFKEHKLVSLETKTKTFRSLGFPGGKLDLGEGVAGQNVSFTPASAMLYQELNEIPAAATTRLPVRKIGDKQAVGFAWESKKEIKTDKGTFTNTFKRIYWVDSATKLLIRMDCSLTSTDPSLKGRREWIKTDFVFDADLDPSLFSTDPPAGYSTGPKLQLLLPPAQGGDQPVDLKLK